MERYMGLVGIVVIIGLGYAMSTDRKHIKWRTVLTGIGIQFVLAVILLKIPITAVIFKKVAAGVTQFLNMSQEGSSFIFGSLTSFADNGFIFAVQVIPTIIFFAAFISVMYYLGIVQIVISVIAKVMRVLMGTSGSETLSCSANIFVGQTEAPLLIRPFLDDLTKSELNAVMVGGFATVAGGVLAAYIGMGISATHLIVGSVMAAPCALAMAKLVVPETEHSVTAGDTKLPTIDSGDNILDAAAKGTSDGLGLAMNVAAMLIAFISLIACVNWAMGGLDTLIDGKILGRELTKNVGKGTEFVGFFPGSLETLFGYIFSPLAYVIGIPWSEATLVGNLLGQKICINEFVAYATLGGLDTSGALSPRSVAISTYALCGFANFSSIGIQVGGISALAPEKRPQLAQLALRAMLTGVLVSCLSASMAGLLYTAPE